MEPVIQEQISGCAIAASAALANISYQQAKSIANQLGIYAEDKTLWSNPDVIRALLNELNIITSKTEIPFTDWATLPDFALLALRWHQVKDQAFWHWAIFVREQDERLYVLDSKASLKQHRRTDFGRMKPKWFIEVYPK